MPNVTDNVWPSISSMTTPIINTRSISCPTNQNYFPNQIRKLQDLPEFSGRPEDWPLLESAYIHTTAVYNYSNFENNQRVQKCLKGEAKEAVSALLIHPENVNNAMEQLRFKFGRPEQLIASQLQIVKEITPITESTLDKIIPFANKVTNLVIFLQSLNSQHHIANPTLLEELINKLPMSQKLDWGKYSAHVMPYPTILEFSRWINDVASLLYRMPGLKRTIPPEPKRRTLLHVTAENKRSSVSCSVCTGKHKVDECKEFRNKSIQEKWKAVKDLKLCFGCLQTGHTIRICKNKKQCTKSGCTRKHNTLLHNPLDTSISQGLPLNNSDTDITGEDNRQSVLSCNRVSPKKNGSLLFRVLPVTLYNHTIQVDTYALLDEGASVTLIDDSLIKLLGLKGQKQDLCVNWFGGKASKNSSMIVNMKISGRHLSGKYDLKNVYGVNNIQLPRQTLTLDPNISEDLKYLPIAQYKNERPLILIGLDHCHLSVPVEIVSLGLNGPYATNTKLGWVVFGPSLGMKGVENVDSCLLMQTNDESLHDIVAEYFETENFGVKPAPSIENEDDIRARKILDETTVRVGNKFQTGLLWRKNIITLPESYDSALQRLKGIERKMIKDNKFATAYKATMSAYVQKGYAQKLKPEEVVNEGRVWYLPHFAVTNPNKPGKFRMVFDAAAKVNNVSLNSCLLKGPLEYRPMPSVLFHFRVGAIAVCGDIREMFHQVFIRPEDRKSQRFLWRDGDATREADIYEMCVMTFGAACSPCAAQYVKLKNALEHHDCNVRAVKSIVDYHYVDDMVDSFDSIEEAIAITNQVRKIHNDCGFELRGFSSNSKKVMKALNGDEITKLQLTKFEDGLSTEKILGIYWEPYHDVFKYILKFHRINPDIIMEKKFPTKRELLKIIMSIFDPLGFLCHLLVTGKLIMREVWRTKMEWDEVIPDHIGRVWNTWLKNLKHVNQVNIPRCYFSDSKPKHTELHIFVDASGDAFAAVAYWRVIEPKLEVTLITAKTKCAPLKTVSIPRLELQAAVLGTRLMVTILESHEVCLKRCILWSDSKTVIKWVKSPIRRYKPFVAHRIAEILASTKPEEWRWLPTKTNIADEATRINGKIDLTSSSRWFHGPQLLYECESEWPEAEFENNETDLEVMSSKFALHMQLDTSLFDLSRFSSYSRALRTVAWTIRAVKIWRKQVVNAEYGIKAEEINEADKTLCKETQNEIYFEELKILQNGNQLEKNHALVSLVPYVDKENIIRVGGRLNRVTWLSVETKNPIILPPKCKLTLLIIMHYHEQYKHQNVEATICAIRNKYWIIHLRQIVRHVIFNCNTCKINRAVPVPPIMGDLPEDRTTPYVRPFTFTGLDYFGPLSVTIGRRTEKRWVALFTCLTVRAIHLEMVKDLSTDACILAIRNFINRRGVPKRIRSDNGKNFIGLANNWQSFTETFNCEQIQGELSNKGVQWLFNCPRNPSEGGAWERMVQCVKRVLKHTLKEIAPQEYTMHSLLIEAENLVNSRPLTHLPVSADDLEPLTPNHFIIGTANIAQSSNAKEPTAIGLRKQWRIAKQLKNAFWRRWVLEYLPTLTRRSKWCQKTKPLQVGDLVLVCDENMIRQSWYRGRIEQVYQGKDGVIRRADVRTRHGVIRRPTSRLALLDVE